MVKVLTPATSANIGPGFDCLGIAYDLFNEFEVELNNELIIEGCDKKYQNENNLFYVGFSKVGERLNRKEKCKVKINSNIPVSRGLGSSASLIVAGVISANILFGNKLNELELFKIATEIEGHPDNIAPCIFGGFTCAYGELDPKYIHLNVNEDLKFTLIIPDYELSTTLSRSVLPKAYERKDVVFNMARNILLTKALESGETDLLKEALQDKIHQPYRKDLIKDYDEIEKLCKDNGAIQMVLSGAGPTMLVLSKIRDFSKIIKPLLNEKYLVLDLNLNKKGAILQ